MDKAGIDGQVSAAWKEVRAFCERLERREASIEDDPQPRLASELFGFFLLQKDSEGGRRARTAAFLMWGNVGDTQAIDDAMATLGDDSGDWAGILRAVANAYARSGRHDDYWRLLGGLEARLSHPKSRSAVHAIQGDRALRAGRLTEARKHYEVVIEINASRTEVVRAEGALYEIEALQPGSVAPNFAATTIDGETIRLTHLHGRVVLLAFWSTSCGPCWAEFPYLRALHDEHPAQELYLVGVSGDSSEVRLREVMKQQRLSWPQIREPVTWQDDVPTFGVVTKLYNVWAIPRTILIDPQGFIVANNLRGEELVAAVRDLTSAGGSGRPGELPQSL